MKKREIENYDLEKLFNNIIEQTPLISEEHVRSLFNHIPKINSARYVKHFIQTHLNFSLGGATVIFISVIAFLWINSWHQSKKATLQSNQNKDQIVSVSTDTIAKESAVFFDKKTSQKKVIKDTILKETTIKTSADTVLTDSPISLSGIYKHFTKRPQKYLIQSDRDTTIICKEGTTIKIKAHSFISEKSRNEISGIIQIAVKEYYKLSDMLLANLTTTSGDKILETGGMIYISAISDDENCKIKPGHKIEIGFPYSHKKEDMLLFYGKQANNKIDWQLPNESKEIITDNDIALSDNRSEPEKQVFFIVEEMPEFPGGEIALRKYLEQNAHYPYSAIKDKIEGKVYVTFVVDKTGNTSDIKVTRSLDKLLDKVAVFVVSNMPKWNPGRQRGKPVNVSYTVPVIFSPKKTELTTEEIEQSKELEEKLKNFKYDIESKSYYANNKEFEELEKKIADDNFQGTSVFEVNRYLFRGTQLGWLNCDRFYRNNNPAINFFILVDDSNKTIVNGILRKSKSLIPGKDQSGKITFDNIPLGEMVTIVALKTVNNQIFLSVKETEITKNGEIVLDFNLVTMESLKKEIEKLNN